MYLRHKNKVIHVLLRPKFTAIIVLWFLAGSIFYYWWYISNIMVLESQPSPVAFKKSMTEEKDSSLCETIHLAMVCMNKCTQNITPMFKSLLYHRQNPLHFHILVDKQTRDTLNTLFKTWELPDELERDYYFQLVLEGSTTEDYVTERMLKPMEYFSVPILYGDTDFSKFFPPGSYINAKGLRPEILAEIIESAIRTPKVYEEFYNWKSEYTYRPRMMNHVCNLCRKLNINYESKPLESFRKWWNPAFNDFCATQKLYDKLLNV